MKRIPSLPIIILSILLLAVPACEDKDEFMRVLEVCDKMLEPEMIVYADLAITSDK